VVDTSTWVAKIVDFADASAASESRDAVDKQSMPLHYVSPEQTGRTGRPVDYRTDLYSLGAVVYHAVSGRHLFELTDPVALVHAHIALQHRSLADMIATIPRQIARVVDKLLAKSADDRYQSARGVTADLEECVRQLRETGGVQDFALGAEELPARFRVAERLYGRGAERVALLEAFEAVTAGEKGVVLVAGYSGMGKSSLVGDLRKSVVARRGTFVSGKFDPLHRHAPYSALQHALAELCRGLMTVSDKELAWWRKRILDQVQNNAGLMTEFVPGLDRIVGAQSPPPETGVVEASHRFEFTLARLLTAFAGPDHPLVLFLDDLQWADPATLHALSAVLRFPEPTHLLVIGAYRDNEVDETHPLPIAIEELRAAGVAVQIVPLAGLTEGDVTSLVADTLRRAPSEVGELAALVRDRTSGNPFFVGEFLRTMHEEKVLRFVPERGAWGWDPSQLGRLRVTTNVADLTARKLRRLPAATQDALRLAACAGDQFELGWLSAAADLPPQSLGDQLAPAVRERFLVPAEPRASAGPAGAGAAERAQVHHAYRFLHDLVRRAAYDSLAADRRPTLHLRLGRTLRARAGLEESTERVFDVVDHLNRATALIDDEGEREDLARLNLEAGRRGRASTAYRESLEYLRAGIALLPRDAWSRLYPLTLELHLRYAECAYLTGRADEARAFSEALLPKIRTAIEKAELYSIGIAVEQNTGHYGRALRLGREALATLGHPAPPRMSSPVLLAASAKVAAATLWRPPDPARVREVADPRLRAVMKILASLVTVAYFGDQRFYFWTVHESVWLGLRYGVSAETPMAFATYAMISAAMGQDYERSVAYGRLALTLARRPESGILRNRVLLGLASSLNPHDGHHIRSCLPLVEQSIELSVETGDLAFISYGSALQPLVMFMAGESVDDVQHAVDLRTRAIRPLHLAEAEVVLGMWGQCARCLRGETRSRGSLTSDDLDEDELEARARATSVTAHASFVTVKAIVLSLFGETDAAVRTIVAGDHLVEAGLRGTAVVSEYGFYGCLSLVEALRREGGREQTRDVGPRRLQRMLRKKHAELARRAHNSPTSFRHKERLVAAEIAELAGQPRRAAALYHEAIEQAAANGYPQHAAVAAEVAARA
jgi:predicted ATPase